MTEQEEFPWFERLQNRLTAVFLADRLDAREAEEAGFFLAQGLRDVPPLLRLIEEVEAHSTDEIMDAIHMVLANRNALQKVNAILLGSSTDQGE